MTKEETIRLSENISYLNQTLIPVILEKIPKQDQEKIKQNLLENLKKKYQKLLLISIKDNTQSLFENELGILKNKWRQMSVEQIEQESIYDSAMERIRETSLEACGMAQTRIKEKTVQTDKEKYEKMINIWKDNEAKVKPWNEEKAKQQMKEGYLDLNFAYGFSEYMSLRLSNYKGGK